MTVETLSSSINISDFAGTIWGGRMNADLSLAKREGGGRSSSFKGTLKQADLGLLAADMGFQGFSIGVGDVEFDLTSPDDSLASAAGDISLEGHKMKIENFGFGKLATFEKMTEVPQNLPQRLNDSFRKNGATTFNDIFGKFKVGQGKVEIESLKMSNADAVMNVTGSADMKAGSYTIEGDLHFLRMKEFPDVRVQRTSGADYAVDSKPVEKMIIRNMPPPPVPVQPEVSPVAPPAQALPPDQSRMEDKGAISGILDRLDDGGATP
jgi:hypothetical protein